MTKEIIEEKEPFYDDMFPNRVDNGKLITVTKN